MKITGKHPTKLNDPIIKNPVMKNRRWTINPNVKTDDMNEFIDTKNNDWDIGYNEFYKDLEEDNQLKGGVGDATAPCDVNQIELSMGITVEKEHTNDINIATEIALDHLKEDPMYYSKLKKAGLAKELTQLNNSTGFGDPTAPINNSSNLGKCKSCPGNNITGTIGNTPTDAVESKPTNNVKVIDYQVDIDIKEPYFESISIKNILKTIFNKI